MIFSEMSKNVSKFYKTVYYNLGIQSSTDAAQEVAGSVIEREAVLSLWCDRRRKRRLKTVVE